MNAPTKNNTAENENAAFTEGEGLLRGQLRVTIRTLAYKWRWHPAKVQRWFQAIQSCAMGECIADTRGITVTICNYEKYQNGNRIDDTPSDTQPIHLPIHPSYIDESKERRKEGRSCCCCCCCWRDCQLRPWQARSAGCCPALPKEAKRSKKEGRKPGEDWSC